MEACTYPAALARRYDRDYAAMGRSARDVGFYVELAHAARGPVLEMACGTGRVLLPIARALAADAADGRGVTGVDPSPEMRAQLLAKLGREPEEVRRRVTIHDGRFHRIPVRGPFALVCSPFRAFQHVHDAGEQRAAVAAMAAVLAPGGTLAFDVFDFDPRLARRDGALDCEYEEDGRHIERRSFTRYDAEASAVQVEMRWYADGEPTGERVEAPMHVYSHDALVDLIARAGLRVEAIHGDFDRSPRVPGTTRELVVVATRPA
jgi:SAM-dependent methyltransferase